MLECVTSDGERVVIDPAAIIAVREAIRTPVNPLTGSPWEPSVALVYLGDGWITVEDPGRWVLQRWVDIRDGS